MVNPEALAPLLVALALALAPRKLLLFSRLSGSDRAVFSFLNPGVFVVIAKLQKAEIRFRPFPEPPNSGGALAPPAPPLNTALQ